MIPEAMKMENEIVAPKAGKVLSVGVQKGDVESGTLPLRHRLIRPNALKTEKECNSNGSYYKLSEEHGVYMLGENPLYLVMIAIACVPSYLAIVKKFEPMLLLPIAFGMLMTNLPGAACTTRRSLRAATCTGRCLQAAFRSRTAAPRPSA